MCLRSTINSGNKNLNSTNKIDEIFILDNQKVLRKYKNKKGCKKRQAIKF